MTYWLIGQAPGPRPGFTSPFEGPPADKLAALAGVSRQVFLAAFERRNLLQAWPGHAGQGDAFPRQAARREAAALQRSFRDGDVVVCAGRAVALCFGLAGTTAPFHWHVVHGVMVAWIPHPSGRNRLWNDPAILAQARPFLHALLASRASQGDHHVP